MEVPEFQWGELILEAFPEAPTQTRRFAAALLVLGLIGFLVLGANRPANPTVVPPQGIVKEHSLEMFGASTFTVTPGPGLAGSVRQHCALVARTPLQQQTGLMHQTSFHGFSGMLFEFSRPSDPSFYMKGTLLPLSIAWFDRRGVYIASANMNPCPPRASCTRQTAGRLASVAIEVPRGGLQALGIGPGSVLQTGPPCVG